MKVYVITTNDYPDYRIAGATLDRKTAKAFAMRNSDERDRYRVDEYDTNDIKILAENDVYVVRYSIERREFYAAKTSMIFYYKENWVSLSNSDYHTYVIAKDEAEALKIGKDRIVPVLVRDGILDAE